MRAKFGLAGGLGLCEKDPNKRSANSDPGNNKAAAPAHDAGVVWVMKSRASQEWDGVAGGGRRATPW